MMISGLIVISSNPRDLRLGYGREGFLILYCITFDLLPMYQLNQAHECTRV
jgi:hypothetical protein